MVTRPAPRWNFAGAPDAARLLLRLGFGGLLAAGHGWGKLAGYETLAPKFADPYGLGPAPSLVLAILAELVCALLVALGLFTRLATIGPLVVMATAYLIIHAADPLARRELALIYFIGFLAILLLGPGRYSLDELRSRRRS